MLNTLDKLFKNNKTHAIYDIEVVDGYFLVGIHALEEDLTIIYTNPSRKQVQNILDEYNLIGFHNQKYDDRILEHYLSTPNVNLKQVSDALINRELFLRRPELETLDISHLLQNWHAKSLKEWESGLGLKIHQATELFDLAADEQDVDELSNYLISDLKATKLVLFKLKNDLTAYVSLVNYIEKNTGIRAITSRNNLTKLLLHPDEGVKTTYYHKYLIEYLKECNIQYKLPMFDDYVNFSTSKGFKRMDLEFIFSSKRSTNRKKKLESQYQPLYYSKADLDKVDEELGEYIGSGGGNHYHSEQMYCKRILASDVSSLYPTAMRNINLFGELTPKYADLIHEKNTTNSKEIKASLKLILNSTYGITRSEHVGDFLYTPYGVDTCIVGNVLFYDAIKRVEALRGKVIQTNTDAIFVDADTMGEKDFHKIIADLEQDYNVLMDRFELNNYYALDVNNYFSDEKAKGLFADNKTVRDMKIIPYVLQLLMRHDGELPADWLEDVIFDDFLRRAKATGQYAHYRCNYTEVPRISEKTGKVLKGSELVLTNPQYLGKIIRSYVSHNKQETIIQRGDGEKFTKVARVPNEYVVCVNDEIGTDLPADLNVQWYVMEAQKRYEKWIKSLKN